MTVVMESITATQFKARCLALLDDVADGEEIVVTKRGKPVARVVPVEERVHDLRGSISQLVSDEELIAPIDLEWDAERD